LKAHTCFKLTSCTSVIIFKLSGMEKGTPCPWVQVSYMANFDTHGCPKWPFLTPKRSFEKFKRHFVDFGLLIKVCSRSFQFWLTTYPPACFKVSKKSVIFTYPKAYNSKNNHSKSMKFSGNKFWNVINRFWKNHWDCASISGTCHTNWLKFPKNRHDKTSLTFVYFDLEDSNFLKIIFMIVFTISESFMKIA
jgi:hypothetical protein